MSLTDKYSYYLQHPELCLPLKEVSPCKNCRLLVKTLKDIIEDVGFEKTICEYCS